MVFFQDHFTVGYGYENGFHVKVWGVPTLHLKTLAQYTGAIHFEAFDWDI